MPNFNFSQAKEGSKPTGSLLDMMSLTGIASLPAL